MSEALPLLQPPTDVRATRERPMNHRVAVAVVGVVALLVAAAAIATTVSRTSWKPIPSSSLTSLNTTSPYAEVLAAYRETHDFDGVVQVRVDDTVVFHAAVGLADEEFDVPMSSGAIFPIGSNSKLFTAVSLYQLQERGLVNLTDPVNQHLDQHDFVRFGFPNQTTWCPRVAGAAPDSPCENITFVQLLHMGSGIGDSLNCDNVDDEHCYRSAGNLLYYEGSLGPYIGMFINDPLVFKPDTNYSYANPNFYLLSYLVEKISGMRFEQYVKSMITDKLGLQDTYYDPYSGGLGIRRRYVQQYTHYYAGDKGDEKTGRVATGTCSPYMNSGAISGSGGFRSTVADMQAWYLDLFGNQGKNSKLLTPESIRMILERVNPINEGYGQGIGVGPLRVDGWPSSLFYCGGMKCATTCMEMLFPENRTESSVVISTFSNHIHVGFADLEAFEAFQPNDSFQSPTTATLVNYGGAANLRGDLIKAYNVSA